MDIDPDQIDTLAFSAGQLLFSEGDQPHFAYFLIKGAGHSYLINEDGPGHPDRYFYAIAIM